MSSLPEDIINYDILTRLPIKSISRFRCVCKTWSNLFTNPVFAKLQLNYSTKHHNPCILINLITGNILQNSICLVDYDSVSSTVTSVVTKIDYPVDYGKQLIVIGICYGLICYIALTNDIIIWNPFTKDYKKLPTPPEPTCLNSGNHYGFGYDAKTEDYKLARIVTCKSKYSDMNVYSLATNSWKTMVNIPFLYPFGKIVLFNGVFHWVESPYIYSGLQRAIGSFDLESETFKEIQLPQELSDRVKFPVLDLRLLEGCLYLLVSMYSFGVDVWMMKEYGVKESWTKMFTIDGKKFGGANRFNLRNSLGNGLLLVETNLADQYLYDLNKEEARKLKIDGIQTPFYPWAFLGSLVSPTSLGTQCKKRKYDKQPQDRSTKPYFQDAEQHFSRKTDQ